MQGIGIEHNQWRGWQGIEPRTNKRLDDNIEILICNDRRTVPGMESKKVLPPYNDKLLGCCRERGKLRGSVCLGRWFVVVAAAAPAAAHDDGDDDDDVDDDAAGNYMDGKAPSKLLS